MDVSNYSDLLDRAFAKAKAELIDSMQKNPVAPPVTVTPNVINPSSAAGKVINLEDRPKFKQG